MFSCIILSCSSGGRPWNSNLKVVVYFHVMHIWLIVCQNSYIFLRLPAVSFTGMLQCALTFSVNKYLNMLSVKVTILLRQLLNFKFNWFFIVSCRMHTLQTYYIPYNVITNADMLNWHWKTEQASLLFVMSWCILLAPVSDICSCCRLSLIAWYLWLMVRKSFLLFRSTDLK